MTPYPSVEMFPEAIKPAPPPKPAPKVRADSPTDTSGAEVCAWCRGTSYVRVYVIEWPGVPAPERIPGQYCSAACARSRSNRLGREV